MNFDSLCLIKIKALWYQVRHQKNLIINYHVSKQAPSQIYCVPYWETEYFLKIFFSKSVKLQIAFTTFGRMRKKRQKQKLKQYNFIFGNVNSIFKSVCHLHVCSWEKISEIETEDSSHRQLMVTADYYYPDWVCLVDVFAIRGWKWLALFIVSEIWLGVWNCISWLVKKVRCFCHTLKIKKQNHLLIQLRG